MQLHEVIDGLPTTDRIDQQPYKECEVSTQTSIEVKSPKSQGNRRMGRAFENSSPAQIKTMVTRVKQLNNNILQQHQRLQWPRPKTDFIQVVNSDQVTTPKVTQRSEHATAIGAPNKVMPNQFEAPILRAPQVFLFDGVRKRKVILKDAVPFYGRPLKF